MKFVSEEQLKKVRDRVLKEGGIQPQYISLPDDYKDRVEAANGESRKILEKIHERGNHV